MLIKCPECGKDVSDQAPRCPHCGFVRSGPPPLRPKPAQPSNATATAIGALASAITGAVVLALLAGAVAFAFLVPVRRCPQCEGVGSFFVKCDHCDGVGKQTIWQILRSD